jgi:hypothetical protein
MTFESRESSNYDGEPVLLYEFRRGTMRARYCASDLPITMTNGDVYAPAPFNNDGIKQKGTAVTDVFEITAPRTVDPAVWFRLTPPSDTVYVALRRFHWGDSESVIIWLGQIISVSDNADESATLRCQAVSVTLRRGGLRMSWQRGCIHALYDQNCMVDKSLFAYPRTISGIGSNYFIASPGIPSEPFWKGGIIEWEPYPGTFEKRLIEDVFGIGGGTAIYPFGQMDGYTVGMDVTLYPGCKRTSIWCDTFFHNMSNFGGFQWLPNRSPYDGDSVF